jgi:hypothetical protein
MRVDGPLAQAASSQTLIGSQVFMPHQYHGSSLARGGRGLCSAMAGAGQSLPHKNLPWNLLKNGSRHEHLERAAVLGRVATGRGGCCV